MRVDLRIIRCGWIAWVAALLFIAVSSAWCHASNVVLIRSAIRPTPEQDDLELATQFYGLDLKVLTIGANLNASALRVIAEKSTAAVAIEADVLMAVHQHTLLRALHRSPENSVPLLILGVTQETSPVLLKAWSGGNAIATGSLQALQRAKYVFGRDRVLTQQLTDLTIPFPAEATSYFILDNSNKAHDILTVSKDRQSVPVFIETTVPVEKIFLLCRTQPSGTYASKTKTEDLATAFARIAPIMMFIKYCAGERGWHSPGHYANLTIDDPWLREPYGDLNYEHLLQEMEKHDFHTTIAFIPWNFDRSDAEVLTLFRQHPDRFSLCIHGNNHDHKEFEDLKSKPLNLQVSALKQALARMEKFRALTGIPYDKVFVFPHSIGPEVTLKELKTYNYLATVNSSNIPMDGIRPSTALFPLRPVTTAFADFPSISRYPAEMANPRAVIAINAFLANPLLFYSHHAFFENNIGAFDAMADEVNKLDPSIHWGSLGEVATHLYTIRLRDDSNYDVLTASGELRLENMSGRDIIYHVNKAETDSPVIASVTVEGRAVPFHLRDGLLHFSIPVPAGEARTVAISYGNDVNNNLMSISISRDSIRVLFLREASDFRDIWLSRSPVGEVLIASYYRGGKTAAYLLAGACTLILFCIGVIWRLLTAQKKRKAIVAASGVIPTDKRESIDRSTPISREMKREH